MFNVPDSAQLDARQGGPMSVFTEAPSAEELRMLRAARQLPVYLLGARVGIHPGRLSMYLRGTLPMPEGVPERIAAALAERESA
jgi:hypothetical protein